MPVELIEIWYANCDLCPWTDESAGSYDDACQLLSAHQYEKH